MKVNPRLMLIPQKPVTYTLKDGTKVTGYRNYMDVHGNVELIIGDQFVTVMKSDLKGDN